MPDLSSENTILTIGHATHTFEQFVCLLYQHQVTAIADVRSVPYSRFLPQFNTGTLKPALKEQGIEYVFLGKELGGRSNDATCYENGRVQYGRLAATSAFRVGIDRVRKGSKDNLIALMCAEGEPIDCHRSLLVSKALVAAQTNIVHILPNGNREFHSDAIKRLQKRLRLPERDLFRSQAELIEEAYLMQEARVAFVDERMVGESH